MQYPFFTTCEPGIDGEWAHLSDDESWWFTTTRPLKLYLTQAAREHFIKEVMLTEAGKLPAMLGWQETSHQTDADYIVVHVTEAYGPSTIPLESLMRLAMAISIRHLETSYTPPKIIQTPETYGDW